MFYFNNVVNSRSTVGTFQSSGQKDMIGGDIFYFAKGNKNTLIITNPSKQKAKTYKILKRKFQIHKSV